MEGVFQCRMKVPHETSAPPPASDLTLWLREKCTDLNAVWALNVLAGIRL